VAKQIVVLITAGSVDEGLKIAHALVEERLAACVNVISPIESIYRWQGQVHEDREVLLIVKTTAEAFDQLTAKVKALHSYQVPEIIALPIVAGSQDYLSWIAAQTS
jgi:periplasmic divalent cation tolerance protein